MKAFILTNESLNKITLQDVKELTGKKARAEGDMVLCENIELKEFATLAYKAQSALKVGILLGSFEIKKDFTDDEFTNDFKKSFANKNKEEWETILEGVENFGVKTEHKEKNPHYSSIELSARIGEVLDEEFKKEGRKINVQLKNPQLPFYIYITEKIVYYGIDLTGINLAKRPYKLLTKSSSINGVLAYSLARLTGVEKNSRFLDPFCGSGTIPIEVAIYQQGKSPFLFKNSFSAFQLPLTKELFKQTAEEIKQQPVEKTKNVYGFDFMLKIAMSAKKNAKIAGILEATTFSKVEVDWLDNKFEEGEIDYIVTNPPKESAKKNNLNDMKKIYEELFYQGKYVLSKKGKLGILTNKTQLLDELAKKYRFEKEEEHKVFSGEQEYYYLIYTPPQTEYDEDI